MRDGGTAEREKNSLRPSVSHSLILSLFFIDVLRASPRHRRIAAVARAHDALVSGAEAHAVDEGAIATAEIREPERAVGGERERRVNIRDGRVVNHQLIVSAAPDADALSASLMTGARNSLRPCDKRNITSQRCAAGFASAAGGDSPIASSASSGKAALIVSLRVKTSKVTFDLHRAERGVTAVVDVLVDRGAQFALQEFKPLLAELRIGFVIVAEFDQVRRHDARAFAPQMFFNRALDGRDKRRQVGARLRIERATQREVERAADAFE